MFKDLQIKTILILLDDEGHAGWELAEHLEVTEGYLNPLLKKLEEYNIIFRGNPRKSKRKKGEKSIKKIAKKREGDYKEVPYYIEKDIDNLRKIIKEIKDTQEMKNDGFLAGYIIKALLESIYAKSVKSIYGRNRFLHAIKQELGKKYNIFIEQFFKYEEIDASYLTTHEPITLTPIDQEDLTTKCLLYDAKNSKGPIVVTYPITKLDFWYLDYLSSRHIYN
jgi:DNA-binding MarR family transcriptional regulator